MTEAAALGCRHAALERLAIHEHAVGTPRQLNEAESRLLPAGKRRSPMKTTGMIPSTEEHS